MIKVFQGMKTELDSIKKTENQEKPGNRKLREEIRNCRGKF